MNIYKTITPENIDLILEYIQQGALIKIDPKQALFSKINIPIKTTIGEYLHGELEYLYPDAIRYKLIDINKTTTLERCFNNHKEHIFDPEVISLLFIDLHRVNIYPISNAYTYDDIVSSVNNNKDLKDKIDIINFSIPWEEVNLRLTHKYHYNKYQLQDAFIGRK